jgi:hypothetical protein
MRIDGRWVTGADGVERPVFDAALLHAGGQRYPIQFVLDTGADFTLLTYDVGQALAAAGLPQPGPVASSAGGTAPTILLDVTLVFTTTDGRLVGLRGPIPALAAPSLLDFPVLGRNAIDLLALAYDRPRGLLALVGSPEQVAIIP